jgi:hypothetical protein
LRLDAILPLQLPRPQWILGWPLPEAGMRPDHEDVGSRQPRLAAIRVIALNAAINGSILADPDACFAMMMLLPFGPTRHWQLPKT